MQIEKFYELFSLTTHEMSSIYTSYVFLNDLQRQGVKLKCHALEEEGYH